MVTSPTPDGFAGRRVLLTGASGYVGSALRRRLAEAGAEVHAVSRNVHTSDQKSVKWWQTDLTNPQASLALAKEVRPELLIHLAGLAAGARDVQLVVPSFAANALSTVNLLTAAAEIGCPRFVYCGSMEEPAETEQDPVPSSPYAASKWVGTVYAKMFRELYDLPVVLLRLFLVYGPGSQPEKKLIPYIISSLLNKEAPRLTSGTRAVDWIYIDDAVDAFLATSIAETTIGKTIDVGSGGRVTIREIAERISTIIDNGVQPIFGAVPERPQEMTPVADIEATKRLVGWSPCTSLDDGLRKTVEWTDNTRRRRYGSAVNDVD